MVIPSEEELRPKYRYAKKVLVSKIVLEVSRVNEDQINRVRLVTNLGDITYKPKKTKTELKESKGFEIEREIADVFTIEDLEDEYPVLFALAKDVKKEEREITLTYVEKDFYNEREETTQTYRFLRDSHIETLYYDGFHKNTDNIKKQQELKKKYSEKEL